MTTEDRRYGLRRIDDVRELLRFCRSFGQNVPTKVVARLDELGIRDAGSRPIGDLLRELDELERPALARLQAERRKRPRRWINPEVIESPDTDL